MGWGCAAPSGQRAGDGDGVAAFLVAGGEDDVYAVEAGGSGGGEAIEGEELQRIAGCEGDAALGLRDVPFQSLQ